MSKGEQTREMILARAAQLFNCHGYAGTSLSDIMRETGLEKGGIYNHFTSKEHLALEAFDYAFGLIRQRIHASLQDKTHAVDRLVGFVLAFASHVEQPALAGGCPVLNTAVEADDAYPELRERARRAGEIWLEFIRENVAEGILQGEIRPEIDPEMVATLLVATLEGAIMLSALYRDRQHMRRVVTHLTSYLETVRM